MPISSYKQNKGGFMKIKVTFITKTGHEVVEEMDSDNGSTCDYEQWHLVGQSKKL